MAKKVANTQVATTRVPNAVREMAAPLRAVYDDIVKKINTATTKTGELQYDIGLKVQLVMDAPDKYDTQAVQKLAEALGGEFNPSTLRAYARVASTFNREEVTAVLSVDNKYGRRLTFSHLGALSAVSKKTDRVKLLRLASAEGLTVKQLAAKIRELLGVRGSGGRPVVAPATPKAGLTQISALLGSFATRADTWEKTVLKPLSSEKTLTPQLRELVISAEQRVEEMQARLEKTKTWLTQLLGQTAKVANEVEDDDDTAEEDDEDEEETPTIDDVVNAEDADDDEDDDESWEEDEDEDEEDELPSQRMARRR